MATKDNNNSGLLSKVAKFVRNPTTNWTDLDKQDPEPDNGYSKQALKEMIERKRQNDFVRRREFDQLRKLRNRDPSAGNPELAGRPSYFQSSMPSHPGERASTIKKIDEIEAQMSNQWWQGKTDAAKPAGAGAAAEPPAPPAAPPATPSVDAQISDIGYVATKLAPMVPEAAPQPRSSFTATGTSTPLAGVSAPLPSHRPDATARSPERAGFAGSRTFTPESAEAVNDPDLEEAAIRFANGDDAGAEMALLEAIRAPGVRREKIEAWSAALFDLYRATGQQARFDSVAIDFAERFGRSAPAWFSMPEVLGIKASVTPVRTSPSRLEDEPAWRSPTHLTQSGVDELQLALANAPSPWFIDWGATEALAANAIGPLADVVAQWAKSPVQLRFRNVHQLERALRAVTPPGNKSINQAAWQLRMDVLRILGLQDDFELVALEHCVTYEVSPPAWQDPRCTYVDESAPPKPSESDAAGPDSEIDPAAEAPDSQGLTLPMGYDSAPAAVVELTGEILGEATESLSRLEHARDGGDRLVVSCANLIRVDFSAAGSILNWVASRQSEGCHVQFREVHRLVAAFFHVIGIHEHARVVLRSH
jgi:anti-anti-sigma regulatory factor